MRVLLDTHVWLWMLSEPGRLPTPVREVLEDDRTEVLVSAASTWEIAIKHALGRLPLPEPPASFVPSRMAVTGCVGLPIEVDHTVRAGALPLHHQDPFDRLLVAQAQALAVPLCSIDDAFADYDVEILWDQATST